VHFLVLTADKFGELLKEYDWVGFLIYVLCVRHQSLGFMMPSCSRFVV
jgi:hypothetical protein